METTPPPARGDPSTASRPPPHTAAAPDTVMVWEAPRAGQPLISRIVAACGAHPQWIAGLHALRQVEVSPRCCLALVALGAGPAPDNLGLDSIRSLTRQGFQVIAYADGAQAWSLGLRCQVLLAGSLWVLDSATPGFAAALQRLLGQLLQAEAERRREADRLTHLMQRMGIVGQSPALLAAFRTILRVSPLSDLPILLTGETGTGKELLARAIHHLDPKRRHAPCVALNCGAISPGLAESELFGHRRGAFSGAERDRKGLIRAAAGGVLFLDEIGELDDALQVKLLRVLQEHRVLGVGDDQELPVDVRVIAATHRDLEAMVHQRTFRADLFHRLNVLSIHLPPLRDRPADIKPLIDHFLEKYRSLRPAPALAVAPDFVDALTQAALPGNARQLENLVRRALVHKDDEAGLSLRDLPHELWQQLAEQETSRTAPPDPASPRQTSPAAPPHPAPADLSSSLVTLLDANGWSLARALQQCERLMLEAALHKTHGSQSHMAQLLKIAPRTVYNKLHQYHLHS